MSSLILVEWSLCMFQPVLTWDANVGKQVERITQSSRTLTGAVANLSITGQRPNQPPSCLDLAMTAIQQLTAKAALYPAIVNGSLQSEPMTFAAFDHSGLQQVSGSYEEFREKLSTACATFPPTKSSFISMLRTVQHMLSTLKTPTNVVVFTSAAATLASHEVATATPDVRRSLLPLGQDSSLFIVPIGRGSVEDDSSLDFFSSLIAMNGSHGCVCWETAQSQTDKDQCRFSLSVLEAATEKLSSLLYRPFTATLIFGELSGRIQLVPSPTSVRGGQNALSEEFKILGVLDKTAVDKLFPVRPYFILPASNAAFPDGTDPLQEPHLVPLLHASLRQMAGKVMLISVAKNWFGFVEPTEDSKTKKKSGLVLNLFPRGISFDSNKPVMIEDEDAAAVLLESSFPSYSPANAGYMAVWTSAEAVQADAARLQRMAKRLPDKKDLFFKELNKIRLHALSTCNTQFLSCLVSIFAREIEFMKDPNGIQELENVLRQLRFSESDANLTAPLVSLDGSVYSLQN